MQTAFLAAVQVVLAAVVSAQQPGRQETAGEIQRRILATIEQRIALAREQEAIARRIADSTASLQSEGKATDIEAGRSAVANLEAQQRTLQLRSELLSARARFTGVSEDSAILTILEQQRKLAQQAVDVLDDLKKRVRVQFDAGLVSIIDLDILLTEGGSARDQVLRLQLQIDEFRLASAQGR